MDAIHTLTKGIARLVNKLITDSLIAACAKKHIPSMMKLFIRHIRKVIFKKELRLLLIW